MQFMVRVGVSIRIRIGIMMIDGNCSASLSNSPLSHVLNLGDMIC